MSTRKKRERAEEAERKAAEKAAKKAGSSVRRATPVTSQEEEKERAEGLPEPEEADGGRGGARDRSQGVPKGSHPTEK